MPINKPIGERRWSDYFTQNIECTGYINDDWWYFKLTVPTKFTQPHFDQNAPVCYRRLDRHRSDYDAEKAKLPEYKAQTKWSLMKPAKP